MNISSVSSAISFRKLSGIHDLISIRLLFSWLTAVFESRGMNDRCSRAMIKVKTWIIKGLRDSVTLRFLTLDLTRELSDGKYIIWLDNFS